MFSTANKPELAELAEVLRQQNCVVPQSEADLTCFRCWFMKRHGIPPEEIHSDPEELRSEMLVFNELRRNASALVHLAN
jgi:hypothetical protein